MPVASSSIQQVVVNATVLPPTGKSSATHPFFCGPPPAVMVAGSRCSGHVSQPSKRTLDPDNIERPNVPKRPCPSHQKNVVNSESDSDEHDKDSVDDTNADGGIKTEVNSDHDSEVVNMDLDLEAVEEAYASTKAMGNADREVSLYFCKFPLHDLLRLSI
jgi:hypothetical protein